MIESLVRTSAVKAAQKILDGITPDNILEKTEIDNLELYLILSDYFELYNIKEFNNQTK